MEEELDKNNGRDMTPQLMGETWRKYPTETSMQKATYGLFECQYCGKEFETQVSNVKRGHTKSCGCQLARYTNPHRLSRNRFYDTWRQMLQRCNNPAWCNLTHPNIEGISLDRIDNNKGYSPNNCRWADTTTQAHNKRMMSNNTSGFVGVYFRVTKNKWYAKVRSNTKLINIGSFHTMEEAVQARDNYIIQNNLPHKLSADYNKDK